MSAESSADRWSGQGVFILAAAGAAIGLSNLWRFPYMMSEYGGYIFLLLYIICLILIGLPVLMTEIILGRMGRCSPINSIGIIAQKNGRSRHWQWLGWLAIMAGFLILSFYSVIVGMGMSYFFRMAGGVFNGQTVDGTTAIFTSIVSDPEKMLIWHTLFMSGVYFATSRGFEYGLERSVRIMVPLMLLILIVLLGYAVASTGFTKGFEYLFANRYTGYQTFAGFGPVLLAALSQAFFTLAVGTGAMMMFAAYLPANVSIRNVSLAIVFMDITMAVLAGLVIYPVIFSADLQQIVFPNNLNPHYGPGLVFQTLPMAFGYLPWGSFFGALFFLMLVLVGMTSAIALAEPAVAYGSERFSWSRARVARTVTILAWLTGLLTVFSFNYISDVYPIARIEVFDRLNAYQLLDFLASKLLLPSGTLLLVIFAGWLVHWQSTEDEMALSREFCGYAMWRIAVRYITPVLLLIVLVSGVHNSVSR